MRGTMRDSSLNQRTYWLRDGLYFSRASNLGEPAVCELPADKLAQIPEMDRKVVVAEAKASPAFCARLARCMATDPDWVHTISRSAKKAIANELDPLVFPESKGTWPMLRELSRVVVSQISSAVSKSGRPDLAAKALSGLGDLGQWDIIASLVGSIGSAAAGVYSSSLTARAQQNIATTQANAAMAAAQAQMSIQNAAAAMQNANASINPISSAVDSITSATVAGVPVLALAIPAIGLIIYLSTKK